MRIELVADCRCMVGESPLWHPDEKCVYWLDIPTGRMFRYRPADGRYEKVYDGLVTGGLSLQKDGSLLMFMAQGMVATWRDGAVAVNIRRRRDEIGFRFNDVLADPEGGVFCGVMDYDGPLTGRWNRSGAGLPVKVVRRMGKMGRRALRRRPPIGWMSRLDVSGRRTTVLDGLGRPNGMGFTPDRKGLYVTDSIAGEILLFDYDADTAALANRRLFARVPGEKGTPDGLAVDAEGFVWSALWNGGALIRYAPDGRIDRKVPLPARKVTSLAFGGEDLTDMFVTTAGGQDCGQEGDGAGALFRLNAGVAGIPEFRSAVDFGYHAAARSAATDPDVP